MQLHVIFSVLFSLLLIFCFLFTENWPIFSRIPSRHPNRKLAIVMRRSRSRKQGPWGLVDPCHMTRETHKVSFGSQKHSCRVVGSLKGHEGQNHRPACGGNTKEHYHLNCWIHLMTCHLIHALGLSNVVNALNVTTIKTRLDDIIIRHRGRPCTFSPCSH